MYLQQLKVDLFLCQMRSSKCLVSFAAITVLLTHHGMYFALVCLMCKWSMFVDKGRQGGVILFLESIMFFGWIVNQFRSKEIFFYFLFVNFMVFMKGDSSIILGSRG